MDAITKCPKNAHQSKIISSQRNRRTVGVIALVQEEKKLLGLIGWPQLIVRRPRIFGLHNELKVEKSAQI